MESLVKIRDISYEPVAPHFRNAPDNAQQIWNEVKGSLVRLTGKTKIYTDEYRTIIGWETEESFPIGYVCSICAEIGD